MFFFRLSYLRFFNHPLAPHDGKRVVLDELRNLKPRKRADVIIREQYLTKFMVHMRKYEIDTVSFI